MGRLCLKEDERHKTYFGIFFKYGEYVYQRIFFCFNQSTSFLFSPVIIYID